MEEKFDNEVSELLRQLEETFDKEKNEDISVTSESQKNVPLSADEILSQLEQHIGGSHNTELSDNETEKDDYNISGYEIQAEEIQNDVTKVVIAPIETYDSGEHISNDTVVEPMIVAEEMPIPDEISYTGSGKTVSDEALFSGAKWGDSAYETEDENGPVTEEQEEAVRRRVESYVLDTLNADGDLSIFESIAGGAAKPSTVTATSEDDEELNELSEMLQDAVVPEEEFETEHPEIEELPEDYVGSGMMNRFFKRDAENLYDERDDDALAFDYKNFNDTDINLALTLGCEEELQHTFGFYRVRSAKNGFRDPAEEASISDSVYAGDGNEYRSYEQTDTIKQRYKLEKRRLYKRFALTFILTVFILFFEHIFITNIEIPYATAFFTAKWRYYLASVFLAVLCSSLSGKKLFGAYRSMFAMRPDPYMAPAFFALLNLIYLIVVLFWYPDHGLLSYNFVYAIFLLFAMSDEYMRLNRESMTFDIISDRKPKLSLERFEGEGEAKKDGSYLGRHDFFVEKVNFVGNYFSRVGRIPSRQHTYAIAFLITILLGVFMMFVSSYMFGRLGNAFQTFFFFMMLAVPMPFLFLGTYPFYFLSKGLKKFDSAILDEEVVDEYVTTDTIYLSDDEMFGMHGASVTGLRLYADMELSDLLYYTRSVFLNLGAPLCHIFDASEREIPNPKEVKINAIATGGIEATVDGSCKVLLGNIAFVRSKGYFPKRNLDDEQKIESGQCSIVYIVIDSILSAKLYIKYSITKRFEKFVDEMVANGISVGIRTLDPSVNARMIAILRGNKKPEIEVIRPTASELVSIGKHSDSGIITGRNSHMIFRILQQCLHIRKIHKKQMLFHIISSLVGAGIVTVLMLGDFFPYIPSLLIVVYHLIWTIAGMIYTRSKLK